MVAEPILFFKFGPPGCFHRRAGRVSKADLEPLSCETLWVLRNSIFDQYGYCFKTQKAKDWFNNDDCKIDDAEALPISPIQKSNIDKIKDMESWKGC